MPFPPDYPGELVPER